MQKASLMIKRGEFVLFLLILIFTIIMGFTKEPALLEVSLKKELLGKAFQTKTPLGITHSFKNGEGYSVKLNVLTEIHSEEIRYFAEGGLKIVTKKSWDASSIVTPKKYSGKYVSLNEIEAVPEGTVIQVKKIDIMRNQLELKLEISGGRDAKLRLMMMENLDLEGIMNQIAQVLKIDYVESLKSLVLKKQEAEKRLNEAASMEDKFKSVFEMKRAIEAILKIEGLSSVIYAKYLKENMEIDSKIQELYGVLKEPVIIVESVILEPEVAKRGDILNLEIKYTFVTPKNEKEFKVIESVTLSGRNIILQLKKRELERTEGSHLFSLQFMIPVDLEEGEYILITAIEVEQKKKIISKSFSLRAESYTAPEVEKIDFTVAGEIAPPGYGETEIKGLIPLLVYHKGEFGSAWEVLETNNPLKHNVLNIKEFWLYYKGTLIGKFKVSGFKEPSEETMFQPYLTGRISWETKPSIDLPDIIKNIIALSHPIPQPFYTKELRLDSGQELELKRIIKETLMRSVYKGTQTISGGAPKRKEVHIFLLEPGGPPTVYANEHWAGKPCDEMDASVLVIWDQRDQRWVVLKRSTYLSEGPCGTGVGDAAFSVSTIGDIDGDGSAELVIDEGMGENWSKTLYKVSNGRLMKLLNIGNYGL